MGLERFLGYRNRTISRKASTTGCPVSTAGASLITADFLLSAKVGHYVDDKFHHGDINGHVCSSSYTVLSSEADLSVFESVLIAIAAAVTLKILNCCMETNLMTGGNCGEPKEVMLQRSWILDVLQEGIILLLSLVFYCFGGIISLLIFYRPNVLQQAHAHAHGSDDIVLLRSILRRF